MEQSALRTWVWCSCVNDHTVFKFQFILLQNLTSTPQSCCFIIFIFIFSSAARHHCAKKIKIKIVARGIRFKSGPPRCAKKEQRCQFSIGVTVHHVMLSSVCLWWRFSYLVNAVSVNLHMSACQLSLNLFIAVLCCWLAVHWHSSLHWVQRIWEDHAVHVHLVTSSHHHGGGGVPLRYRANRLYWSIQGAALFAWSGRF